MGPRGLGIELDKGRIGSGEGLIARFIAVIEQRPHLSGGDRETLVRAGAAGLPGPLRQQGEAPRTRANQRQDQVEGGAGAPIGVDGGPEAEGGDAAHIVTTGPGRQGTPLTATSTAWTP